MFQLRLLTENSRTACTVSAFTVLVCLCFKTPPLGGKQHTLLDFSLFEHVCVKSPCGAPNILRKQGGVLDFTLVGCVCFKPPQWETELFLYSPALCKTLPHLSMCVSRPLVGNISSMSSRMVC